MDRNLQQSFNPGGKDPPECGKCLIAICEAIFI